MINKSVPFFEFVPFFELPVVNSGARAALFGDGTQTGGLISNVVIGGTGDSQNHYDNIRFILRQLQISNTSAQNGDLEGAAGGHQNHFHIYLRPPTPVDLPDQLLAEESAAGPLPAIDNADLQLAAQAMINQLQPDFGFEEGEVTMFIMDAPDLPQQSPQAQVMLVQAAQTQQAKAQYDRIVGVCDTAEAGGGGFPLFPHCRIISR